MNVTHKHQGAHLASSRLRMIIPAQAMAARGVKPGKDWLVIGKHNWDWAEQTAGYRRVCFDVCDDHFADQWADHYVSCCSRADLVTCNTPWMAERIEALTSRKAVVIPDPYEQPERPARVHDRLLWFGHRENIPSLNAVLPLPWPVEVVTNSTAPGVTNWSQEAMDKAFDRAGLCIIPSTGKPGKSANRALDAIRRGLFVVAGPVPAYADLGIWIGDIREGVTWALSHQDEALRRIKAAQGYIATEYSPERIAGLWLDALRHA